jgi:hypothetical protein
MDFLIERSLVEKIRQEILNHCEGELSRLFLELQDGGTFLLISADVSPECGPQEIQELCELIRAIAGPEFPPKAHGYSWMAVIIVNEEVVETLMS